MDVRARIEETAKETVWPEVNAVDHQEFRSRFMIVFLSEVMKGLAQPNRRTMG